MHAKNMVDFLEKHQKNETFDLANITRFSRILLEEPTRCFLGIMHIGTAAFAVSIQRDGMVSSKGVQSYSEIKLYMSRIDPENGARRQWGILAENLDNAIKLFPEISQVEWIDVRQTDWDKERKNAYSIYGKVSRSDYEGSKNDPSN